MEKSVLDHYVYYPALIQHRKDFYDGSYILAAAVQSLALLSSVSPFFC
jgi:hypothetical protein